MATISNVNQAPISPLISDRALSTSLPPSATRNTTPAQSANPVNTTGKSSGTSDASNRDQVNSAVDKINKFVQASAQGVEFSLNNDFNKLVVKVVDQQTNEVIRQIPSEEALEIARSLDKLQGLLIRQTA
jgi:flagellar protein FlaG